MQDVQWGKTIGISLTFSGERIIESIHINHHHFVHSKEASIITYSHGLGDGVYFYNKLS